MTSAHHRPWMKMMYYRDSLEAELPQGWDLTHAFFNVDDDVDFDNSPEVNYVTGALQGAADMIGLDIPAFLSLIPRS